MLNFIEVKNIRRKKHVTIRLYFLFRYFLSLNVVSSLKSRVTFFFFFTNDLFVLNLWTFLLCASLISFPQTQQCVYHTKSIPAKLLRIGGGGLRRTASRACRRRGGRHLTRHIDWWGDEKEISWRPPFHHSDISVCLSILLRHSFSMYLCCSLSVCPSLLPRIRVSCNVLGPIVFLFYLYPPAWASSSPGPRRRQPVIMCKRYG